MSGYYETIPLDDTTVFKWTRQDMRPDDIEIAEWDVYGVVITGEYKLSTLAETKARLTQLAEIAESQAKTFSLWGDIWRPYAYIRHSVVGTYWVNPDSHPTIRLSEEDNKAYICFYMRYIGDTSTHVACYLVEGVETIESDWNI